MTAKYDGFFVPALVWPSAHGTSGGVEGGAVPETSRPLGPLGAHRAPCMRCAESRVFSAPGSHGSQGPELCTPEAVLNGSRTLL